LAPVHPAYVLPQAPGAGAAGGLTQHAGAAANPSHPVAEPSRRGAEELDGEIFKSPMVGTFYSAPAPDAEPFVKAGEKVKPEQTICIIEAMKVMNEIKAERPLTVVRILAQNGEPVEFGQPLFLVKP